VHVVHRARAQMRSEWQLSAETLRVPAHLASGVSVE
jgi:hypothetical protein